MSTYAKLIFVIILLLTGFKGNAGTYYVSTEGSDSNPGTHESPFKNISRAIDIAEPGDTIYILKGLYEYNFGIGIGTSKNGTPENMFHLYSYPGDTVTIDFYKQPFGDRGISLRAEYWHIKGLIICNSGDNGMHIEGANNIIENCVFYGNDDTGLQISGNGSFNIIVNCDSYNNVDPDHGDADGFAAKLEVGPGNKFIGCRAWNNSDDGWDLFEADDSVVIENCWVFSNGYLPNGDESSGNGNGFKLGGNHVSGNHLVKNCLAFGNRKYGYHQNNNTGKVTIYNSLGWDNVQRNYNFYLEEAGQNTITNCISFNGGSEDSFTNCDLITNSWQGLNADESDFITMDVTQAKDARLPDGSMPTNNFARLTLESDLIDVGTDIGIPYNGLAPDLGLFETPGNEVQYILNVNINGSGGVWMDPDGGLYEEGLEVRLIAWKDPEYDFDGWNGDTCGSNDTLWITIDSDKNITACFTPIDNSEPDSTRIEAEDMSLTAYIFERFSTASNGKVVRNNTTGFGSAVNTFNGSEDNYLVRVCYLDQVDGTATYRFSVNDELISTWVGDSVLYTNKFVHKIIYNVVLSADDEIKVESKAEGSENGRIDFIEIIRSEYIQSDNASSYFTINEELYQNCPNPFDYITSISFSLKSASDITLELYDLQGRLQKVLLKGYYFPGLYSYEFINDNLSPGTYYYRLGTREGSHSKALLIK
ncbi:MAG: right-handed parallel beta-helix repeat-containing protein [Bacteroidales bacterium]|nr:right-handed parallel beta-helix repeat-containing protein [Bacteroidales bacterium]